MDLTVLAQTDPTRRRAWQLWILRTLSDGLPVEAAMVNAPCVLERYLCVSDRRMCVVWEAMRPIRGAIRSNVPAAYSVQRVSAEDDLLLDTEA